MVELVQSKSNPILRRNFVIALYKVPAVDGEAVTIQRLFQWFDFYKAIRYDDKELLRTLLDQIEGFVRVLQHILRVCSAIRCNIGKSL